MSASVRMKVVLGILFVIIFTPALSRCSSMGDQRLNFIAKGHNTYWITEDVAGQYETSALLQLVVVEDSASLGKMYMDEFMAWDWLEQSARHIRTEQPLELKPDQNGRLTADGVDFIITAPDHDQGLIEKFNQHVHEGGSNAVTWHRQSDDWDMQLPSFDSARVEPLYHYPAGLYVNYELAGGYWFARSGQVLVFTHQPIQAVGMDTMHGFLLLEVKQ